MGAEMAIRELTQTLDGDSTDAKVVAVLALPDDATAATAALKAALEGADPMLEVVLLDALYRLNRDPHVEERLIAILDSPAAQGDGGEELYMMARIALNRVLADDGDAVSGESSAVVAEAVLGVEPGGLVKLAVIVHGTWARDGAWWRSQGDFHTYLKAKCGVDHLYDGDEPFIWSGRNRDQARSDAADAFGRWVIRHDPEELEVYAHSHGANVAMLSTHLGLEIDKLVMMSPPVRKDYFAQWDRVGEAFNIQSKFDPVVGIARGGRWFELGGRVRELELDVRGHSVSHDPDVWEQFKVPEFVGLR